MAISRRTMLAGAVAIGGALAAEPGEACSIVARQLPINFSDRDCRASLQDLVDRINLAREAQAGGSPALGEDEYLPIDFDDSVVEQVLNQRPAPYGIETGQVLAAWTMANGQRDRAPVELREVDRIKARKGFALYAFVLRRESYVPEVTEEEVESSSCGGIARAAYFQETDLAYLGTFRNNRLRKVTVFDDWLEQNY